MFMVQFMESNLFNGVYEPVVTEVKDQNQSIDFKNQIQEKFNQNNSIIQSNQNNQVVQETNQTKVKKSQKNQIINFTKNSIYNSLYATSEISGILFAYNLCFRMLTLKEQTDGLKEQSEAIPAILAAKLATANAMRGSNGIAGAITNANFANNGFMNKGLNALQDSFYNSASKGKASGLKSFLKYSAAIYVGSAATLFLWDATDEYFGGKTEYKAAQWTWALWASVYGLIVNGALVQCALRKYLLTSETPFMEVQIGDIFYKVKNPYFGGDKNDPGFENEEYVKEEDVSSEIWNIIQKKIKGGYCKPVDGNFVQNYYGVKSALVRGGVGLGAAGLSLSVGCAERMIDDDKSFQTTVMKYGALATQDLNSTYGILFPLLQPIVSQFVKNNFVDPYTQKKKSLKNLLKLVSAMGSTYGLSILCYGSYRLIADKILFKINFLSPAEANNNVGLFNNISLSNNFMGLVGGNVSSHSSGISGAFSGALQEFIAYNPLGLAIGLESIAFFTCFDALLNSFMSKSKLIKASPKIMAAILNLSFTICVLVNAYAMDDEYIGQYLTAVTCGTLYALLRKAQYLADNDDLNIDEIEDNIDYSEDFEELFSENVKDYEEMDVDEIMPISTSLQSLDSANSVNSMKKNKSKSMAELNKSYEKFGSSYYGSQANVYKAKSGKFRGDVGVQVNADSIDEFMSLSLV